MTLAKVQPQRSFGTGALIVRHLDGKTRIADLYQQGCSKIRMPTTHQSPSLDAVMINTAGGVTGGDELNWSFRAEQAASLNVTTQACERIYRSSGDRAAINVDLAVGRDAQLRWLPQETILFDGCAVKRNINVAMDEGATLLIVEPLVFGRQAMNEVVEQGYFKDHWRIYHQDRLVHAEDFIFAGSIAADLKQCAVTGGDIAVATVLLVETGESSAMPTTAEAVRELLGDQGGFSQWTVDKVTKSMVRLIAKDSYELRKRLLPLIGLLNGENALPKCWSI